MGVPTSEVGYTSATTGRGDHEVYREHVVTLERKKIICGFFFQNLFEEGTLTHCSTCSFHWEITAIKDVGLKGPLNKAGDERTVT
jgi:hypothetical protein